MTPRPEPPAPAAPPPPAWEPRLQAALPAYGYPLPPGAAGAAARARMAAFLQAIVAAQARVRLLGSLDPETLVRRHLGESLYLGALRPLAHQRLVDVGSGAGFPGLALALGWPGLTTTLVESNHKKAAFLRATVAALGLAAQVQVGEGFLERRRRGPAPGPLAEAELVTVRALERMEQLPAWLGRWLAPETQVALWTTRAQAQAWRQQYPGWRWGEFYPLPGARERGILLAVAVPRET